MDLRLLLNRNDPDLPSSREGISLNLPEKGVQGFLYSLATAHDGCRLVPRANAQERKFLREGCDMQS